MGGLLAIWGAGGHGRVVADCAIAAGWRDVVFFDEQGAGSSGVWSVVGAGRDLFTGAHAFDGVLAATGDNLERLARTDELARRGLPLVSLVHPRAMVSDHAQIGPGTVVLAGAVVNIGARLGRAVIVNTLASVDHDCLLADGVHVSPGAHLAGGVRVGRAGWIGVGAAVRQGIEIGDQAVVGAGAAVVKSVPSNATVVGVPARPI